MVSSARWLVVLFLAMIVVTAISTYSGLLTILVSLSSTLSTMGAFQSSDRRFRLLLMGSTVLMVLHNLLVFTPAGVFLELFFLGSNLVGYYRHYLRRPRLRQVD